MELNLVKRFASLFLGRTDVWGALHGEAMKEPVTVARYRLHLEGRVSLGIYPLLGNGLVRWIAIDIDKLDVHLALAVFQSLHSLGVNKGVYIARSRQKGFHVLVLLSGWTSAVDMRRIAKAALSLAGLPGATEVFPKQDHLSKETPWGNYLNLPYFGGGDSEGRRMVLETDSLIPIPLTRWLDEVTAFDVSGLSSALGRLPGGPASHPSENTATTTLAESVKGTYSTGTRRPTLVSLSGHLRVRGVEEDVAVELLLPWAREHFEPALPDQEVEKHIRGIYQRYGVANLPSSRPKQTGDLPSIEVKS